MVDGYLTKKKTGLSAPVLVKTIPATTVAYMRIRPESYDALLDRMPEMGALMEKAGCECALPEYYEDLGDGIYQVYVEVGGEVVPFGTVDSATGEYHE